MKMLGRREIESLLQVQEWPAISIYMPTSRIGDQQDAIRYKNLLSRVEKKLIDQGMRASEARNLLEPEYVLAQDPDYWMNLGMEGLTVFLSGKRQSHYHLPLTLKELVMVGERFHIKPLIPLLASERYLVLALSKNNLRLFHGDRHRLSEIELPAETPGSMAEALQYDDPERQLQFHTKTGSADGRRGAIFHGQGGGVDDEKTNLERYFQAVDRSLFPLLEDEEFPVVLAGTEELHAIYHTITKSHTILPGGIPGNVSDLSAEDFHRKAWTIAGEYFSEAEKEAVRSFHEHLAGSRAVDDLQSVLAAAFDGRVENLFVSQNEEVWGAFDPVKREAILLDQDDPKAVDLLDQAIVWTLTTKGNIYARKRQDMPVDSVICAQLRY
ncbi:MAG: hypothetical protein M8357_10115 [Desulfobulbaceae bacterium]|nr:hypothetical protein [Desulfobulbaceae bacterium]